MGDRLRSKMGTGYAIPNFYPGHCQAIDDRPEIGDCVACPHLGVIRSATQFQAASR
jgi:hypothetical protein